MLRRGRMLTGATTLVVVLLSSPLATAGSAQRSPDSHPSKDDGESESGETELPIVGPAARGAPRVRYAAGELLVRFHAGTSSAEMRAAVRRAGGLLTGAVSKLSLQLVTVPVGRVDRALASLRSEPSVESAEREVVLEALDTVPNDELWSTQWGWRLVEAPRAWDVSRGAPGVLIAVLDTGVDSDHPDLAGATVAGRDFVADDADPSDVNGHGTAAAGVIAARTNNREGQSSVCWVCSLLPVRVLDKNGAGKTATVAAGIVWAVDNGAHVLNLSLGGPQGTNALETAVKYALSRNVVVVASAGNSGVDTPFYPAAYESVVGVAGTTEADAPYEWSNYGSWVQLAAPGCNTAPRAGGGYVEFCGTSAAAPIVAGIAGLALGLNPSASSGDIVRALAQSATPLPGVVRFGRVNAPSTLSGVLATRTATPAQAPPPPPPVTPPPQPSPPAPPAITPPALGLGPAVVRSPRLRGLARVGSKLRVTPGAWARVPARFAYAWQRCAPNGTRCVAIRRARKAVYRLTRLDRGRRIRAVVVASNANGAATALTGASSIVRARPASRLRR